MKYLFLAEENFKSNLETCRFLIFRYQLIQFLFIYRLWHLRKFQTFPYIQAVKLGKIASSLYVSATGLGKNAKVSPYMKNCFSPIYKLQDIFRWLQAKCERSQAVGLEKISNPLFIHRLWDLGKILSSVGDFTIRDSV